MKSRVTSLTYQLHFVRLLYLKYKTLIEMDVDEKLGLLQNVKVENWCEKDGIHDLPRLSSDNGISVVLESS